LQEQVRFVVNQDSRTFKTGANGSEIFIPPKIPGGQLKNEWKFPIQNCPKCGYTAQRCSIGRKFHTIDSSPKNSGNLNRNFWFYRKRHSYFSAIQQSTSEFTIIQFLV